MLFFLLACNQVTDTRLATGVKPQPLLESNSVICTLLHSIGLKKYATFKDLNQSCLGRNTIDQLDSEQKELIGIGLCQIKEKLRDGRFGELIKYPVSGGCLKGIVGIQDYSDNPILENEIDSLANKTFDKVLVSIILNSSSSNTGLYIDNTTKALSGLTFTVNENLGRDEFGETTTTRFYIFQRFKDGFFLTAVLCAG